MIPDLRREFNARFKPERYRQMLDNIDARIGCHVGFRVAETPCFFPEKVLHDMAKTGAELTHTLVSDPHYLRNSDSAIPPQFRVHGDSPHPNFMTADFGFVKQNDGSLAPRLVELQAFPSIFGYQAVLSEMYRSAYDLDPALNAFLDGHTEQSFWALLSRVILGGHDPENVVLVEIDPHNQKTLPDFLITAARLGIRIVDVRDLVPVEQPGKATSLCYADGKRLVPVRRIYNRTIVDELIRRKIALPFDYRGEFDVEWAGHPNWYFRISKYSIPFLHHPAVPRAVFLDDWFADKSSLPQDRKFLILKPLFSFAGLGIRFAPTDEDLAAIPVQSRRDYLLQERVHFEPVIATPFGPTQAEVRILYVWPDDGDLQPVVSLIRLGRGMMMGVDHNRDQQWVGASASYSPAQ